ncbi:hypothetical protein [Halomonas cupida]|uniref:hypothetical protein n=1 Tax=Halomonas cupida TaxID=44933 RepID=UPI003A8DBA64
MAWMLVMGSVMLSVVVCLGWAGWALGRWCLGRLNTSSAPPKKSTSRRTPTPSKRQPTARRKTSSTRSSTSRSTAGKADAEPSPPWGLTRLLASCRAALPLGLLVLFLFGGARLAEVGMQSSSQSVPDGYHKVVAVLGWTASLTLLLAVLSLLASWRIAWYEARQ